MTRAEYAAFRLAVRTALTKEFPGLAGRIWVRRTEMATNVTIRGLTTIFVYGNPDPEEDAKAVARDLRSMGPQT